MIMMVLALSVSKSLFPRSTQHSRALKSRFANAYLLRLKLKANQRTVTWSEWMPRLPKNTNLAVLYSYFNFRVDSFLTDDGSVYFHSYYESSFDFKIHM